MREPQITPELRLAYSFKQQQNYRAAIKAFHQSLPTSMHPAHLLFEIAVLHQMMGEHLEAAKVYKRVLDLEPNHPDALYNCAQVHTTTTLNLPKADELLKHLLTVEPESSRTHWAVASLRIMQKRLIEAVESLKKAHAINPDSDRIEYDLIVTKAKICQWDERDGDEKRLHDILSQQPEPTVGTPPYPVVALNYFDFSPALHHFVAERSIQYLQKVNRALLAQTQFPHHARPAGKKVRIGYLSPDLRHHAVGRLLVDFFKHHDRSKTMIFAYYLTPISDEVTENIKSQVDRFVPVSNHSPLQIAQQIYGDEIDILVDLGGQTTNARIEVAMLKPAPLLVSWLGYLETTGEPLYDCIVADDTSMPDELQQYFVEEPLMLERCILPPAPMPISEKKVTRSDVGLPEEALVLACFSSVYKYEPTLFACWMEILKQTENTVLWLYDGDQPEVRMHLWNEAQKVGVSQERVVFCSSVDHSEHLTRLALADLYLDTVIYNGGSTLVGVLQQGVPVLTVTGHNFMQRMGSSLCKSVGFDEGCCADQTEYQLKAIQFCNDPSYRQQLNEKMIEVKKQFSDSTMKEFVSDLESVLLQRFAKCEFTSENSYFSST